MVDASPLALDNAKIPVFNLETDNGITCIFSKDKVHRYVWRTEVNPIGQGGACNFLMLNPSTADCDGPDPTVRRCMGYAKLWGYGELVVTNVFAYRSTDPEALKRVVDPVGPHNNRMIRETAQSSALVVCAWGVHAHGRGQTVAKMLRNNGVDLYALKVTQDGHPGHPLYLKKDLTPVLWRES